MTKLFLRLSVLQRESIKSSDYHMNLIKIWQIRKQHIKNPEDTKSFDCTFGWNSYRQEKQDLISLFTYENQSFTDASCSSAIIVNGFCILLPLFKFHLSILSLLYSFCDIYLISFLIIWTIVLLNILLVVFNFFGIV